MSLKRLWPLLGKKRQILYGGTRKILVFIDGLQILHEGKQGQ